MNRREALVGAAALAVSVGTPFAAVGLGVTAPEPIKASKIMTLAEAKAYAKAYIKHLRWEASGVEADAFTDSRGTHLGVVGVHLASGESLSFTISLPTIQDGLFEKRLKSGLAQLFISLYFTENRQKAFGPNYPKGVVRHRSLSELYLDYPQWG